MTKNKQPNLIKQFDKRTGNTYIYESIAYWDSEKKQSRAKRKLVGKLDPETGKMVPTDGRMKKKNKLSLRLKLLVNQRSLIGFMIPPRFQAIHKSYAKCSMVTIRKMIYSLNLT